MQLLGNVLQDAGINIDSVASSITTKSGRSVIESLIDGERRPAVLADLALGRMRIKIPDLTMDARIEAMMAPFAPPGTYVPRPWGRLPLRAARFPPPS